MCHLAFETHIWCTMRGTGGQHTDFRRTIEAGDKVWSDAALMDVGCRSKISQLQNIVLLVQLRRQRRQCEYSWKNTADPQPPGFTDGVGARSWRDRDEPRWILAMLHAYCVGGFGMSPGCVVLVCSWQRLLVGRHLLPFPWGTSSHIANYCTTPIQLLRCLSREHP